MSIGIKAMFLDLHNPGSLEARELNGYVNWIVVGTVVVSIPLLIEKFKLFQVWGRKLESSTEEEQLVMIKTALTPIVKKSLFILTMVVILAFIIQVYGGFTPEEIAHYKAYYSQKPIGYP